MALSTLQDRADGAQFCSRARLSFGGSRAPAPRLYARVTAEPPEPGRVARLSASQPAGQARRLIGGVAVVRRQRMPASMKSSFAVEYGRGVADFVLGAEVLDHLVRVEDVGAHLVAPRRLDVPGERASSRRPPVPSSGAGAGTAARAGQRRFCAGISRSAWTPRCRWGCASGAPRVRGVDGLAAGAGGAEDVTRISLSGMSMESVCSISGITSTAAKEVWRRPGCRTGLIRTGGGCRPRRSACRRHRAP